MKCGPEENKNKNNSFNPGPPTEHGGHSVPGDNCLHIAFLLELEARCAKKGVLKLCLLESSKGFVRRQVSSTWVPYLFILEGSTLWQCDFDTNGGCVNVLGMSLSHSETGSASAYMDFADNVNNDTCFIVEVDEIQQLGATEIVDKDHVLKVSPIKLHLEAANRSEAADWVSQICNDVNHQFGDDDAMMWLSESSISKNEYLKSIEDYDILARLKTFEGSLQNDVLRGAFRKYLEKESKGVLLSFWEHAEDFRRACASSRDVHRFAFDGTQRIDEAMRHGWAKSILDKFIGDKTTLQISSVPISGQDAYPDMFSSLQDEVFRRLKHDEGFFTTFTSLPDYSETLRRAVYTDKRAKAGLKTLSTFTRGNDKIADSDQGLVDEPDNAVKTDNYGERANSIISLIVRPSSSKSPNEASYKKCQIPNKIPVRETWWRSEKAREESTITIMPGWWWRFTDLSDISMSEAEEITVTKMPSASTGERRMEELAVLYSEADLRMLLAGKYTKLIVLPSLMGSANYSAAPLLETYGAVKFVGAMMVASVGSEDPALPFSCSLIDFNGLGRIMLYHPDGSLVGRIQLELISSVQGSTTRLHSFVLYEGTGNSRNAVCEISPSRHLSETQSFAVAQAFFKEVSRFCPIDAVSIIHAGFVEKRKEGHTAIFRKRWAMLLSSGILVYYKPSDSRREASYRGEIRLEVAQIRIYAASGPLCFSIETPAKKFQFRVAQKLERDDWARVLGATAAAVHHPTLQ